MVYCRTLPDLSGRLDKAQNHHHSHHPFDALIRFALRMEIEDSISYCKWESQIVQAQDVSSLCLVM